MVHLTRAPQGGLAVGVGAFGRALWVEREPRCHRWSVWSSRVPKAFGCGDWDDGFGGAGTREPRHPLPGGTSGAARLQRPGAG